MLIFNLKKEWYEKIKSGEKTHEYREVKSYWINRLANACKDEVFKEEIFNNGNNKHPFFMHCNFDDICFCCGYPKTNDKEKRIMAKIQFLSLLKDGLDTDLNINKPVFDIEFELIEEVKNDK